MTEFISFDKYTGLLNAVAKLQQRVTQLERRILTLEEQASPDRGPRIGG